MVNMIALIKIFGVFEMTLGIIGVIVTIFSGFSIIMFSAPINFVCGLGVYNLKEWGRKLSIILAVAIILPKVVYGVYLLQLKYFTYWHSILGLVLFIITIGFFTHEKVKMAFKKQQ